MLKTEIVVPVIADSDLKKRVESVRKIANNWAADISALVTESEEWKNYTNDPCTADRLRPMANGIVKNQSLRRMFMDASDIYINRHLEKRGAQQKQNHD